jgi:hypothetical protein
LTATGLKIDYFHDTLAAEDVVVASNTLGEAKMF